MKTYWGDAMRPLEWVDSLFVYEANLVRYLSNSKLGRLWEDLTLILNFFFFFFGARLKPEYKKLSARD